MWDNTISEQLKRGNVNMLVAGCFLALISITFLAFTARTTLNEILGPVTMTPAEVLKIEDPSKIFRYYICTQGTRVSAPIWQVAYSSLNRRTQQLEVTVNSQIQMLQLADRFVLIRRAKASKDTGIAGALIKVPQDLGEVVSKINSNPKLQANFVPLLIDSTRFNWGGYASLILITPLLISGIILIRKALARFSDKFQNPSIQSLKRFGDARSVLPEIEHELKNDIFRSSMLWLTKNWLITGKLTGLEIRNIKELVWIYPQTTSHSVNFIPTGKTHRLIICDNSGKYTQIPLPSGDFAKILETLHTHAPWAFYGFEPEHRKRWRSKKDRVEMIAEVEERRLAAEKT